MGLGLCDLQPASQKPDFLNVAAGDVVIVRDQPAGVGSAERLWWMGQVVFIEGSARDPKAPSLFQVADVDSGCIRWCNANSVEKILISR